MSHEQKLEPTAIEKITTNQSEVHKSLTTTATITTAKKISAKQISNSSPLSGRVQEFEKTARYMMKKQHDIEVKLDESIIAAVDSKTVEHLKMLVAPDAAALVLETHGNPPCDLSNNVMGMQSILRKKFREVQNSK